MRLVQLACRALSVQSPSNSCDADVAVGLNPAGSSRCLKNRLLLLTGLLTACLAGCATTGSGMCTSGECTPYNMSACGTSTDYRSGGCDSAGCDSGECRTGGCRAGKDGRDRKICRVGCREDEITACQIASACNVPRELRKTSLPEYRIEIPDILQIQAVHNLRPADALINAGEPLIVQVNGTIPAGQQESPVARQFKQINGIYVIGTDGYVNLGPEYGKVLVAEQNLEEIQRRVESHLQRILTDPQVLVTLPNPQNKQVVAGQHLVRMDGTVGLGIYGSVYVNGMTRDEARRAVEQHLSQHIHNPQVSLDVLAYNSKKYYVVVDGGGAGEQVVPLPSTGNETVLDAVASIQGLPSVASKADIWVARPAPGCCTDQVLPVDWNAIVQGAQTETNYQVLPGDRIYVKADKMVAFGTHMAKFTAPFERLFGFALLGNGTVRTFQLGRSAFGNGGGI